MKTTLTIAVLMMSFASASVFAEGSKVTQSELTNLSINENAIGLAIDNSKAVIGSISVTDSEISQSEITNLSINKNSIALAIDNSKAIVGSVNID